MGAGRLQPLSPWDESRHAHERHDIRCVSRCACSGGRAKSPAIATQRRAKSVLYWHDPMVPGQKFDKPGKSPFMDMQLVPVYADGGGDQGAVAISPRVQQNLGVRTAEVKSGRFRRSRGPSAAWLQRARCGGRASAKQRFLEHFMCVRHSTRYARKPWPSFTSPIGLPRRKNTCRRNGSVRGRTPLVSQDSPMPPSNGMRLAGMSDAQIAAVEAGGKVQARLTITAPIGGVSGSSLHAKV